MGLWVEEDLGVAEIAGRDASEVGVGERGEVGWGQEDGHADEVVVEEVLEGGEPVVAFAEGGGGCEGWVIFGRWQGNVVLLGEFEEEVGFESAFYVQVVFDFGDGGEERVHRSLTHLDCGGRLSACRSVSRLDASR